VADQGPIGRHAEEVAMRAGWARGLIPVAVAVALAAPAGAASPQAPGEASLAARVDELFADYDRAGSPGCALAVIRDGAIVHARGYGMANLDLGVALSPRSVFDIGSTSKQFTAASILLLAQEGRLGLDDEVRRHVPELPVYSRPIRIRHLLHHTSGLRDYLDLMALRGESFDGVTTEADALDLIVRQKETNFPPGDEHLYSNTGYLLLSVIVSRAGGRPLAEFARERIFDPLGMRDTHVHDDHRRIVANRATAYSPRESGGFEIDMSGFEQTGDGAVMTTVEDLFLWDQNFYHARVGGQALLDEMLTPGTLDDGRALAYAKGLMLETYRGLRMVHHGGGWAGYRAELIRFPEQRFSVACLCNGGAINPGLLARQVADLYLADQFRQEPVADAGPAAVSPSKDDLDEIAGIYVDPRTGAVRRVWSQDGTPVIQGLGPPVDLVAVGPREFRVAMLPSGGPILRFEPARGRAARLTIRREDGSVESFEPAPGPPPAADELAAAAGDYWSEELQIGWELAFEHGELHRKLRHAPPQLLEPVYRDAVAGGGVQIVFVRDARGRIESMRVSTGRGVRDLLFTRRPG
jgi:CubicO group peptidase (beta-lactamase class C family)